MCEARDKDTGMRAYVQLTYKKGDSICLPSFGKDIGRVQMQVSKAKRLVTVQLIGHMGGQA